ncbi:hypothetical protein SH139x_005395 [Planctomycetaceae bacterium SH139]
MNNVSTKQHRIAKLAKRSPELVFTSLGHLIDLEWLLEAYRSTRKNGASGVDGQTAAEHEVNLIANPQSLLSRVHSGTYRAPPVRRVQIPKGSWCKVHRHDRIVDQHAALCQKIRGHDAYYGITGNGESLKTFRFLAHRAWRRWLSRRHRKRKLDWDKSNRLLANFPLQYAGVAGTLQVAGLNENTYATSSGIQNFQAVRRQPAGERCPRTSRACSPRYLVAPSPG